MITSHTTVERYLALTNHRLKDILHAFDELLINLDDQIIQNLPVVSQVKVQQTMFVLLRSVVFCVDLRIQTLKVKGERSAVIQHLTFQDLSAHHPPHSIYCIHFTETHLHSKS